MTLDYERSTLREMKDLKSKSEITKSEKLRYHELGEQLRLVRKATQHKQTLANLTNEYA